MPRLANRSQRPESSPASGRVSTQPQYEQQACNLNASGRRALGELSSNRDAGTYGHFIKDSMGYIGLSVSDIHERFRSQKERLESIQRRRREKAIADKTPDEERLEAHLAQFGQEIDALTRESEKSIRDLVDYRAELEDETTVMSDLYTAASTQQNEVLTRRRAAEAEEEAQEQKYQDEEDKAPSESTRDAYRAQKRQKQDTFEQMTAHQRYGMNNDYAAFKRLWHDAAQGEDGAPLPDASRWFRSDGQPVMSSATTGTGFEETVADDEDDDIAVAREIRSINCPLTLRPMVDPYSNHKCKHTFEKTAIIDYLSPRGSKQCPQTGCSQTFTLAKFAQDFYLDNAVLRRIERSKQAEARMDELDVYDEEETLRSEADVAVPPTPSSSRRIKREKSHVNN